MSDNPNRPVPTQAENDALVTGQMHPDEISNPGELEATARKRRAEEDLKEFERREEQAQSQERQRLQQAQGTHATPERTAAPARRPAEPEAQPKT